MSDEHGVSPEHGTLQHIARGNISPACGFAKRILDGEEIVAAHRAEAAAWE